MEDPVTYIAAKSDTLQLHSYQPACDSSLIVFDTQDKSGLTEILRISDSKFIFRGTEIEDAGEAHAAFVEAFDLLTFHHKSVLKRTVADILGDAISLVGQFAEDEARLCRDKRYKALCDAYELYRNEA
jgi:hypothetical protein